VVARGGREIGHGGCCRLLRDLLDVGGWRGWCGLVACATGAGMASG